MKYVSITNGGMLAATAALLFRNGIDVEDRDIAIGMEAPYLFAFQSDRYCAGKALYTPSYLNNYLVPKGFSLNLESLPRAEAIQRMTDNEAVVLPLRIQTQIIHPVLFTDYDHCAFHFDNIKMKISPEPDTLVLTKQMLQHRLSERVSLYTLKRCEPTPFNPIPILVESLDTLDQFYFDIRAWYRKKIYPDALIKLRHTHLDPLLKHMSPLMPLAGDMQLHRIMKELYHHLTHVGYLQEGPSEYLDDYVPWPYLKVVIHGIREIIFDRFYALGVSDEFIDSRAKLIAPE